jgi:type 1 glutamine amidotransferase/nicotinamidase-related amidase
MLRRIRLYLLPAFLLAAFPLAGKDAAPTDRKADEDVLVLTDRSRQKVDDAGKFYREREEVLRWKPKETAIVICDMWDKHWCNCATQRVAEMAPKMNEVVKAARKKGVFIIHAPSDCMDFYKDTPQRKLAQSAPMAKHAPKDVDEGCRRLDREPDYPIDDRDGGCDDATPGKSHHAWKRQIDAIEIADGDAVTASGREIFNLMEQRGIKNVMLMGVHTNMCVVGRPFGLRQMVKAGRNAILVRDLTDAMYNPKKAPFVHHWRGTELVIEHIEKHICPSIHSSEITGKRKQPHVVFIIGEDEYRTNETLPTFAKTELEPRGVKVTIIQADRDRPHDFPGMEKLSEADVVLLSTRRRAPSKARMEALKAYLARGKPLIGIRTASHAFEPKEKYPEANPTWPTFDVDVLGAKYEGHFGNVPTRVQVKAEAAKHPILAGVEPLDIKVTSTLYRSRKLAKTTTTLMEGRLVGMDVHEPVAWTNTHQGARIFYTSLGNVDDFANANFRRMLLNAIFWAQERQVPEVKPGSKR